VEKSSRAFIAISITLLLQRLHKSRRHVAKTMTFINIIKLLPGENMK
jgi:hypothetical protein